MTPNLLILDTETTGIDPEHDRAIEIGAILYSGQHQTTLAQLSFLLYAESNAAEHINHIPAASLSALPETYEEQSLSLLQTMAAQADYAVAHNASFDRQWFDGDRLPVLIGADNSPLRWLCSMSDMSWPRQTRQRESLVNLALNHGIGISSAHRALTDCQLLAELFNRISADEFDTLMTDALRPKAIFQAHVSYNDRHLAKAAGFRWNGRDKIWTRRMAIEEATQLPFETTQI